MIKIKYYPLQSRHCSAERDYYDTKFTLIISDVSVCNFYAVQFNVLWFRLLHSGRNRPDTEHPVLPQYFWIIRLYTKPNIPLNRNILKRQVARI